MSKKTTQKSNLCKKAAKMCTYFYGVDVSMSELVVAELLEDNTYQRSTFKNTDRGIIDFITTIKVKNSTLVTLEATGTYSMKLVFALSEAQIPTAVLNPKQSKGFINGVLLSTTKTDDKDACALALYGKINRPETYIIPDVNILKMKQLRRLLAMWQKQKNAITNHLHALSFHPFPSDIVINQLEAQAAILEKNIETIKQQLCTLSEESFDELYKFALTVKGIGPAIATALLNVTNGCSGFKNAKQLAKFIGVCPTQKESGKSKGRGNMAKTGESRVRALLYMGARSAKRYNLECKDLYERLRSRGKCHKVAMNAVCHKLVRQFFAVVTKKEEFDNEFQLKKMNNS